MTATPTTLANRFAALMLALAVNTMIIGTVAYLFDGQPSQRTAWVLAG